MAPQTANDLMSEHADPLAAYDYELPPELVAQQPARRRVQARLMFMGRDGGPPAHRRIADLCTILRPGDLLVLNDTKVVPARLLAQKPTGGKVEVFFLSPSLPLERLDGGGQRHEVLLRSSRPVKVGQVLDLPGGERITVLKRGEKGAAVVLTSCDALHLAEKYGLVPLPPYIKRPEGPTGGDKDRYQTVYAANDGAVAAPTAGLHLSAELLAALRRRGVETAHLTLHVGYGTFAEPSPEDLARGRLHAEWVELGRETSRAVAQTKARGGRVIPVGTTSMRALEWLAGPGGVPRDHKGWCDIMIAPGHEFKVADGLLTNFHLPRTTLLMLVSALAGRQRVLDAYREAVALKYRFYSFGDATLIL